MRKTALWSTRVYNRLFYSIGLDQTQVTKYSENVIILSFLDSKGKKGLQHGWQGERIQADHMIHLQIQNSFGLVGLNQQT